jgi:hypothetical protein
MSGGFSPFGGRNNRIGLFRPLGLSRRTAAQDCQMMNAEAARHLAQSVATRSEEPAQ